MESTAANGGVTLRACKNALARLKVQVVFRLVFVALALVPLWAGLAAWRLWLVLTALAVMDVPAVILTFWPDVCMGVLSTRRAYDCIDYPGFFPERKIDLLLAPPFDAKKRIAAAALTALLGWLFNARQIVRLTADFIDITRCLPRKKGGFPVLWKRFCSGLGLPAALFVLWCGSAGLIASPLADAAGLSRADPYRFRSAVDEEAENAVLSALSQTLREENYIYYVQIPFNENGFAAQNVSGRQSASYLACVTHQMTTQESWEIVLTLDEERSAAWANEADVVHPIRFDAQSQSETIYVSGSDEKTVYYRDASGAYTSCEQDDAPESYRTLLRYILLDASKVQAMQSDGEHTAVDSDSGFIHIRYETETERITVGVKDDRYPYEASYAVSGENAFSMKTEAIRFDSLHAFTLPQ